MNFLSIKELALIFFSLVFILGLVPFITNILESFKVERDVRRKVAHNLITVPLIPLFLLKASSFVTAVPFVFFGIFGTVVLVFSNKTRKWIEDSIKRNETGDIYIQGLFISIGIVTSILINWDINNGSSRIYVLLAIWTWSIGDSFANLVGKKYAKTKLKMYPFNGQKSMTGSLAFFISVFIFQTFLLSVSNKLNLSEICKITAVSLVSAFIELVSINGIDSVTVPTFASIIFRLLSVS